MQSLAILGLLDGVVSGHGFLSWAPGTAPEKPGDSSVHLKKDKELAPGMCFSNPVGRFVLAVSRDPSTAHMQSPRGN